MGACTQQLEGCFLFNEMIIRRIIMQSCYEIVANLKIPTRFFFLGGGGDSRASPPPPLITLQKELDSHL